MAKRRELDFDSDDDTNHPNKYNTYSSPYFEIDEFSELIDVVNDRLPTPIETPYCFDSNQLNPQYAIKANSSPSTPGKSQKKRKGKAKESETSSDEERWLDAIESGKLEEVDDELKKIRNPKLMTARQRAIFERSNDREQSPSTEMLMSLPIGYKEKIMTAESIQKAQLKSQKRKQMADEKREKDKQKTMDRLLKKQEIKQRFQGKSRVSKTSQPMILYHSTVHGNTISVPPGHDFPLTKQVAKDPPKPIICGVEGCTNLKIYNCSKTNVPLCSFECYKKNLESFKKIL